MKPIQLLFISLLFSFGCSYPPYTSIVPITETPSATLSKELLGEWYSILESRDEDVLQPKKFLDIMEWDEDMFLAVELSIDRYNKVWNSIINGTEYINLQPLGYGIFDPETYEEMGKKHHILRYRFVDTVSILNALPDTLLNKVAFTKEVSDKFLKGPILEINNLGQDSFKLSFKTAIEFEQHIQENQTEFDAAFSNYWMPCVRKKSLTWPFVNHKWLPYVKRVEKVNISTQKVKVEDVGTFKKMSDTFIRDSVQKEVIPKDAFLKQFEHSYFQFKGESWWKVLPEFYVLHLEDGRMVRLAFSRFIIYDITHDYTYSYVKN